MKNIKILDPQKRKINNKDVWSGAFSSEHVIGLFCKSEGSQAEIINHKINSTSDISIDEHLQHIANEITLHIQALENKNDESMLLLPNTRDIKLDVGIITTARSTGIIYNPEFTILAGNYRIVWQWEVTCQGSAAKECKSSPGIMTIFQGSKSAINLKPNSPKWLKAYDEIKKSIGGKPENIVIDMLLDQTRFI